MSYYLQDMQNHADKNEKTEPTKLQEIKTMLSIEELLQLPDNLSDDEFLAKLRAM